MPEPQRSRRGLRVELGDLRRHGLERECLKCDAIRSGRRVGTKHSATCRTRFEGVFIDAGNDNRVERAAVRRHEVQEAAQGRFAAGPSDDEIIIQDARGDDGDQNMEAASKDLQQEKETSMPRSCFHR